MKKILIPLGVAVAVVLGGVLFFLRSGGPSQAAALAPGDSVLFLNIPNIPRTGFRWTGTALARLAAEQDVQAFLEKPLQTFLEAPGTREARIHLDALKLGNLFLATASDASEGSRTLLGFQFWGTRRDFDQAIARLRQELPATGPAPVKATHRDVEILITRHGDHSLCTATVGRWGFLATSQKLLNDALDRAAGYAVAEPALATNPRFLKVAAHLPEEPEFFAFLQPEKAVSALLAAGNALGAQPIPSQIEQLKSIEAVGFCLQIDGLLQRDALFVLRPGPVDSPRQPVHRAMAFTHTDTALFLDVEINFSSLPSWIEGLEESYPLVAEAAMPFASAVALAYGAECAVIADWPQGNMMPAPLLAVRVKDRAQADQVLARTLALLPGATRQEIRGTSVYSFPSQYTSFSVAQTEDFLLAGLDPDAVVAAATRGKTGPTLAEAPVFKPSLADYTRSNEAFCFLDTGVMFERLYDSLVPVLRFSAAMMPDPNSPIDVSKIPPAASVSQHLPPITLSQSRSPDGTLVESSGPVTMSQMLLLGTAAAASIQQSFFGH